MGGKFDRLSIFYRVYTYGQNNSPDELIVSDELIGYLYDLIPSIYISRIKLILRAEDDPAVLDWLL